MRLTICLLLGVAVLAMALPIAAVAGSIFLPVDLYVTGDTPRSATAADFDDDGNPDFVIADYLDQSLSIFLGDGSGAFPPTTTATDVSGPWNMAVGDFNEDLNLDIVVANKVSDDVSLFLGDGDGGFGPQQSFDTTERRPFDVAVGDFDEDTHLDVVSCSDIGNHVELFLGDGTGSLSPNGTVPVGNAPQAIVAVDLDHDGHLDLAVANDGDNDVSILLGDGDGGFTAAVPVEVGNSPRDIGWGDFDENGDPDLVICNTGSSNVTIVLGNGDGSFGGQQHLTTGREPRGIAVADFNGDNDLDVVTGNLLTDDVTVLLGDGAGGLGGRADHEAGIEPQGIDAGDFDRNGVPDVVVANWLSNDAGVLLSLFTPTPVALASFTATPGPDGVFLRWRTTIEDNHAGFFVSRALATGAANANAGDGGNSSGFVRMHTELISAPGPYHFMDDSAQLGSDYEYRLEAVDRSGGLAVAGRLRVSVPFTPVGPTRIAASVAPSPGRAPIHVAFELPEAGEVDASVYDSTGRHVSTLYTGQMSRGLHSLQWDGEGVGESAPAGIYFVRLETDFGALSKKVTLMW